MNGLFYNGIEIYGNVSQSTVNKADIIVEGILEANEMWRDDETKNEYFVFAESGDELYVHNFSSFLFEYVDRITLDVIDSYASFDELLHTILNHILEIYD